MRAYLMIPAALLLAAACSETTPPPDDGGSLTGDARLRVVHTVAGGPTVDVLIGGQVAIANLAPGQVSAVTEIPDGAQAIAFRRAGASEFAPPTTLDFAAGDTTTILTVDSSTIINPWVLTDTGSVVPASASKLRVVHFAESMPGLLAWRTQPDHQDFITIQFPFPYRSASPYLQSDPGDWQVMIAAEAYSGGVPVATDTLVAPQTITIPDGASRTVIVLDAVGGGIEIVVIDP